jgi:hypothetical protein
VQPTPYVPRSGKGACLAGQNKERGLEDVFGIMNIAQNPPTNGQDHRPMSPQKGGESLLIMQSQKLLE